MEDTISNPSMEPLLFSVDPMSLILSQNSYTHQIKLLADGLSEFERGPRYAEYARLRESKLQMKRDYEKILKEEEERFFGGDQPRKKAAIRFGFTGEEEIRVSPEKIQQTRFGFSFKQPANPNPNPNPRKTASSLAQSVPDFSAIIRKENRRPTNSNALPRRAELTPPPTKSRNAAVFAGSASSVRGSISASAGVKKSNGMPRKSYANVEDLKTISMAAASAINGGGGGRKSIGGGRNILGCRQMH